MPGKHHSSSRTDPLLIILIVILLIGLIAAGVLLFRALNGRDEGQKSPEPSAAPNSQSAQPTQAPTPTPEPTPTPTPEPTPTPGPIPDNGEDGYLSEGIYVWNNMEFELFYGYDEASQPYAEAIDSFAQRLPGDVKVYNIVVPNHSEYGLPKRIRDAMGCGSQADNIEYIYGTYKYARGVNICPTLDQHKEEYIYFDTDTHWTALGAYYAYEEFCKAAEVPCSGLDQFTLESHEGFHGYLAEMTGIYPVDDRIDVYEPGYPYTAAVSYDGYDFTELDGVNSSDSSMGYSMFLWGDQPCVRIQNQNSYLGRKLAVVKESYGNAIGAFMGASFDEVYMIDFRNFEGNLPELVREHGITDVVFLNSTIAANTYARVEDLYTLFQ